MEALLPPIATPAAIPSPDPENTRESDSGALMFDSCEFDMAAIVMAIRNFRTQRQEATTDNLLDGLTLVLVSITQWSLSRNTGNEDRQMYCSRNTLFSPFSPLLIRLQSVVSGRENNNRKTSKKVHDDQGTAVVLCDLAS